MTLTLAGWWLAQPWLAMVYYEDQLLRGAYPSMADSIGIPIGDDWLLWLAVTPIVAGLVAIAVRRYRAGAFYFGWDGTHPLWTSVVTVAAIVITLVIVLAATADWRDGYPLLACAQLPGPLALAWLRGGLVAHSAAGADAPPAG